MKLVIDVRADWVKFIFEKFDGVNDFILEGRVDSNNPVMLHEAMKKIESGTMVELEAKLHEPCPCCGRIM